MIIEAHTYKDRTFVVARASISHPLADEVSMAIGDNGMCSFPESVEIAFFMNGEWVCEILPEFAEYADGDAGGTRVYAYVPQLLFASFLDTYSVKVNS